MQELLEVRLVEPLEVVAAEDRRVGYARPQDLVKRMGADPLGTFDGRQVLTRCLLPDLDTGGLLGWRSPERS